MSKHTLGLFLIIPSIIYYFRDFKKLLCRAVGVVVPCTIFLIYLLWNDALYPFIDLCFLGLLDFSSDNSRPFSLYFFLSIFLLIIQIIITIKNKKDIHNCYLIMGFSFMIPLFDFHHFAIYSICFVLQILDFIPIKKNYYYGLIVFLSVLYSVLLFISFCVLLKPVWASDILGFQYTLCAKEEYQKSIKYFEFFDQYDNKLILSPNAMQYKTSRGEDITYFDLFMDGNFGYHGNEKMINKIEDMDDVYIIVNLVFYRNDNPYNQFNKAIVEYVMDSYEKVDSYEDFAIYYKN